MSLKSLLNESNLLKSDIIKNDIINNNLFKTKNIMLYGAPGVGKTHNYKRLITMIENGESEKTIFNTISKNETTNNFDNSIFETIKNEKNNRSSTFINHSIIQFLFKRRFRMRSKSNLCRKS